MDEYRDFTYDEVKFAGLPEFVDDLHSKGMHYVLMIVSFPFAIIYFSSCLVLLSQKVWLLVYLYVKIIFLEKVPLSKSNFKNL